MKFGNRVAFDYETTGLSPWKGARPFLLGIEDENGQVLLARKGTPAWDEARRVLENPNIEKFGHNVKFDLHMAKVDGVTVRGKIHDTMLLVYMNNEYEPSLKLKEVAHRQLNMLPSEELLVKMELSRIEREEGREPNYSDLPKHLLDPYLEGDLDRTIKLFWKHEHVIDGPQRRVYEIEQELIPNIVEMESWGIHIDEEYCKEMLSQFHPRLNTIANNVQSMAGIKFNLNSNKQLGDVLESIGIDTGERNKDGSMSTSIENLQRYKENEIVKSLLEYRNLNKLGTTYFEAFLEHAVDGVVHPSFWPFGQDKGIKTGRFSSSDPNFQNIPGSGSRGGNSEMTRDPGLVRRAITPRPGYTMVFGDYKQIEFVIFACNSGDPGILAELRAGVDFHTANAYRMFGRNCLDGKTKDEIKKIRAQAKELNFAFIFGMGVGTYAARANIPVQLAKERKAKFFSEVPAARDFLLRAQADLLRDGFVQDQFGRRYHVPRDLCYKAANCLCQGPAALVMKRGINRVYDRLSGFDAHPFVTIHDELGVEVKTDQVRDFIPVMTEAMEDRENFPVPIQVEIAVARDNWGDKKKWDDVKDNYKKIVG